MSARLSIPEAAKAFKYITDNQESLPGMSEQELIADIVLETGVSLTTGQLRVLLTEAGIKLDSTERLGYYIAAAIAQRMSWPIGTLISEGKALERERLSAISNRNPTKPLPLNATPNNDRSRVQDASPERGQAEAPKGQDSDAETDFPE